MSLALPSVHEIRSRIASIEETEIKSCFQFTYLAAARISEVVGEASTSDTSVARGPSATDCYKTLFASDQFGEIEAIVFKLSTAKRGGAERLCALPLDRNYEPWTAEVYEWFQFSRKRSCVWPFTRQKAWQYAKEIFQGLSYPIERYSIKENGLTKTVDRHPRPFRLHALRHMRATELVEHYGFDGIDLSSYGGWTLRSTIGVGSGVSRYIHLNWRRYFPKLLRKRVW